MSQNMSQKDKDALFVLAFFVWIIGSSMGGIFLHALSASDLMDWIIVGFVLAWAVVIGYFYYRITRSP